MLETWGEAAGKGVGGRLQGGVRAPTCPGPGCTARREPRASSRASRGRAVFKAHGAACRVPAAAPARRVGGARAGCVKSRTSQKHENCIVTPRNESGRETGTRCKRDRSPGSSSPPASLPGDKGTGGRRLPRSPRVGRPGQTPASHPSAPHISPQGATASGISEEHKPWAVCPQLQRRDAEFSRRGNSTEKPGAARAWLGEPGAGRTPRSSDDTEATSCQESLPRWRRMAPGRAPAPQQCEPAPRPPRPPPRPAARPRLFTQTVCSTKNAVLDRVSRVTRLVRSTLPQCHPARGPERGPSRRPPCLLPAVRPGLGQLGRLSPPTSEAKKDSHPDL